MSVLSLVHSEYVGLPECYVAGVGGSSCHGGQRQSPRKTTNHALPAGVDQCRGWPMQRRKFRAVLKRVPCVLCAPCGVSAGAELQERPPGVQGQLAGTDWQRAAQGPADDTHTYTLHCCLYGIKVLRYAYRRYTCCSCRIVHHVLYFRRDVALCAADMLLLSCWCAPVAGHSPPRGPQA
jgi:hypothetical protein